MSNYTFRLHKHECEETKKEKPVEYKVKEMIINKKTPTSNNIRFKHDKEQKMEERYYLGWVVLDEVQDVKPDTHKFLVNKSLN